MLRSLLTIAILLMLAPVARCDEPVIDATAIDQVVEEAPAQAAPEPEATAEEGKQDAAIEEAKPDAEEAEAKPRAEEAEAKQDAEKADVKQDAAKEEKPAAKRARKKRGGNLGNVGNAVRALFGVAIPQPAEVMQVLGAPQNEQEAQIKQVAEQFTQQFRPLLASELRFIRLTCSLSPAARPKIRAAGEEALKDATRKMAEGHFNRPGAIGRRSNIRDALANALTFALEESLAPEELAAYRAEAAHRADRVREAAILSVVSHLDSIVFLKEQQRHQISKAISENWQTEWEGWLMISRYGNQYFPAGADPFITPALNEEQQEVWGGLQKIDFGFHFFNDGVAPPNDDEWWNGAADPQPGNPNQPDRKAD